MKFLALNADFDSLSPDPLTLRRSAQASVKEGYLLKSGYFTTIGSSSARTVVDKHRYPAYHAKR